MAQQLAGCYKKLHQTSGLDPEKGLKPSIAGKRRKLMGVSSRIVWNEFVEVRSSSVSGREDVR
jgi:hypothetical protein